MDTEINVHDPTYIVRRRIGQKIESGSREEEIAEVENSGKQIDKTVIENIIMDYQKEIQDSMQGLQGGDMLGKAEMMEGMDEEDLNEEIMKVMRVSSLKLAYQNYSVFKSIAVN